MNLNLFDESAQETVALEKNKSVSIRPAKVSPANHALAQQIPQLLRLGTSSWTFPGWAGIVWDQPYAEAKLSKEGCLLTVSIRCCAPSA